MHVRVRPLHEHAGARVENRRLLLGLAPEVCDEREIVAKIRAAAALGLHPFDLKKVPRRHGAVALRTRAEEAPAFAVDRFLLEHTPDVEAHALDRGPGCVCFHVLARLHSQSHASIDVAVAGLAGVVPFQVDLLVVLLGEDRLHAGLAIDVVHRERVGAISSDIRQGYHDAGDRHVRLVDRLVSPDRHANPVADLGEVRVLV
mmetsp:Transcript_6698/g.23287  ORF Transcript_6698/g.23287 Transcript_6698/m.23287 type:complete len:202 (+) Transcript_6698:8799-9404(+)